MRQPVNVAVLGRGERTQVDQRPDVMLYSLQNSGASALDPILRELLGSHGYATFFGRTDPASIEWGKRDRAPVYYWSHRPIVEFAGQIGSRRLRIVTLDRDPRDAIVSHAHLVALDQGLPNEPEAMARLYKGIISGFDRFLLNALRWRACADMRIQFDALKADVPGTVRRIVRAFEVPGMSDREIEEVTARHSFLAQTGRMEGDSGPSIRTKYFFRNGTSGQWRQHFDAETAAYFEERCGALSRLLGY